MFRFLEEYFYFSSLYGNSSLQKISLNSWKNYPIPTVPMFFLSNSHLQKIIREFKFRELNKRR